MATLSVNGTSASAPHICAPAARSDGLGELHNDLCAAEMAMDLRQSLQVIVSANDVLARRLRGGALRAQLTLIEGAAMRLAGTVDQLVEVLRLQEASTRVQKRAGSIRPIFADLASEFTGGQD
ncbi:MAG: hypothetical protein WA633_11780 [Stellaceae bacterium]